jgi:hypothetical protein
MRKSRLNSFALTLVVLVVLLVLPSRTRAAVTLVQGFSQCSGSALVSSYNGSFLFGGSATANNLLVLIVSAQNAAAISQPAGFFTAINQVTGTTAPSQAIFYRIATGGEGFSGNGGLSVFFFAPTRPCMSLYEYSGTSLNSPLHGIGSFTALASTSLSSGTVSPSASNDLFVAGFADNLATITANFTATTGGFTDQTFGGVNGGATGAKTAAVYAHCLGSGCSTSTTTTITNSGDYRGQIATFYPKTTSGNTPTGTNVQTTSGNASLTFPNVTGAGTTTVDSIDPTNPSQGSPPSGITYNSTSPAYNITTTATVTGSINVCISAATITDPAAFANLKLLHKEGATLVNRTTAVNFSSKLICGAVTSLSPFIVGSGSSPTAATAEISGAITDANGAPVAGVTIKLIGSGSSEAITDSSGRYSFEGVETNGFYTITPSRANYMFTPADRSFSLLGARTEASFAANPNDDQANAIDTVGFFVRQQYLDFLGREPDAPGFNGWVNTLRNCGAGDTNCDRVHVSEMFYRSLEFQERGYFAYRFYATAFGRKPGLAEFMPDLQRLGGFLTSAQLAAAKNSLADEFVDRPEFVSCYGSLSNPAYVDLLTSTAGVNLANRQTLIDSLNSGAMTRAGVLRQIAESAEVHAKYFNQAFVVMEYFGYLRRDPDALYLNWIQVLDANPSDSRRMVEGFVNSNEYRNRFAPSSTAIAVETTRSPD